MGSRGGAKASVDFIYLAPVLDKGATVRDMCDVTKITRDPAAVADGYSVHFLSLRDRKKEVACAKRVVLAAGTMSTLRLLFAGSSGEPGGLNPMPSLGHRFGGNGDLIGAWFKPSVRSPMFESAPVLGRFKVDGQDTPFLGMWSLAGIEKVPLLPGWKKKLGKTVPLIGMGADTGKVTVRFEKGRLKVDYDPNQQPIFERIRAAFLALGTQTGLKTWAIKKPITVHAWGGIASAPVPKVASSITRARFTETPAFSSRMRPRYRPRSGRLRRSLSRHGLTTSLTVSHTPRQEIRESTPSRFQFERIIDRNIYHETMSSGASCSLRRARRTAFRRSCMA